MKETNASNQVAAFAAIVRTLTEHSRKSVVTWNDWQLHDSATLRSILTGTMFDEYSNPTLAYYTVQLELAKLLSKQRKTP